MKRLMVLWVGFGLILLAGGFESSLAEETDLALQTYTQSIDSLRTESLKEWAEKNFAYVKPGPADPGKVCGELLLGGFGSVIFGAVGAHIGYSTTYDGGDGFLNFSGLPGAIAGYLIASNVGCATGVGLVGNSGGEKGSYFAAFGGSLAGTLVGGLCAFSLLAGSDGDASWASFFVFTAAQAGGATLCFNQTRKKKVEVSGEALLNLQGGKLALAFPQVNISQDSFKSSNYRVNLFQGKF